MGWLVFSRHRDEDVVIMVPPSTEETKVVVRVMDIRDDKVRIGTKAPPQVAVDRAEVAERKAGET